MLICLQRNLTHLGRHQYVPGVGLGTAKCPYDPADNSTALWVSRGNPADLPGLYTGTNAEFTKADTVIFRTDLFNMSTGRREFSFRRTLKYDSKWLDSKYFWSFYFVHIIASQCTVGLAGPWVESRVPRPSQWGLRAPLGDSLPIRVGHWCVRFLPDFATHSISTDLEGSLPMRLSSIIGRESTTYSRCALISGVHKISNTDWWDASMQGWRIAVDISLPVRHCNLYICKAQWHSKDVRKNMAEKSRIGILKLIHYLIMKKLGLCFYF